MRSVGFEDPVIGAGGGDGRDPDEVVSRLIHPVSSYDQYVRENPWPVCEQQHWDVTSSSSAFHAEGILSSVHPS